MLKINNIDVSYGEAKILSAINLEVGTKELVSLVGANGAGKSTLLKAISGLLTPQNGGIWFNEQRIDGKPPEEIVEAGISQVPEGRRLFEKLTVADNLDLGAYSEPSSGHRNGERINWIFELFPILEERERQKAGTLSGGEQQMLAIARALMSDPKLLMLDEPSLGLMPLYIEKVFDALGAIREEKTAIFLVEQNVQRALEEADRGYILQNGRVKTKGKAEDLLDSDEVREAYLGM